MLNQPTFLDVAKKFISFGAYVAPAEPASATETGKRVLLEGWQNLATQDLAQVMAWNAKEPRYNCAIVGKAEVGCIWGFDDDGGILSEYESVHGAIKTYRTRSVSGGTHLLFKANAASIAMGNLTVKDENGKELFSCRVDNRYVIAAGSLAHPYNDLNLPVAAYQAIDRITPIEAPDKFLAFLKERSARKSAAVTHAVAPAVAPDGVVVQGGRNNFLASELGRARQKDSLDKTQLFELGQRLNEKCSPPLSEGEVRTIANSIGGYEVKPETVTYFDGLTLSTEGAIAKVEEPARPMEVEPINRAETVVNSIDYLPSSTLASARLQDIYMEFADNDWPLTLALPALVTAASVVVPKMPRDAMVVGADDQMTNLYTALIAEVNAGKSQITSWAASAIGIFEPSGFAGSHYIEGKWGSAEQMLKSLHRRQSKFTHEAALVNPDEWAHLFAKAGIPDASFPTILTTAFYRRNHCFTLGGPGGGKEYALNLAMSFIGGIVEDQFDTVFGANSLGGLYDRFLFGRAPQGFHWNYRPYPFQQKKHWEEWNLKPVQIDGSVYEELKGWSKENPGLGRISEICSRIAVIYACLDNRLSITGKDIEPLKPLALYQLGLRQMFRPNEGESSDAVYSNRALAWANKHASEWVSLRKLFHALQRLEAKLGPNVAERALRGLARMGRIDLWWATGGYPIPEEYKGPIPRIGLVRRVV